MSAPPLSMSLEEGEVEREGREEVEEEKEAWLEEKEERVWKGALSWPRRRPALWCLGSRREAEAMLRGRGIPEPEWDTVRTFPPALILGELGRLAGGQDNADGATDKRGHELIPYQWRLERSLRAAENGGEILSTQSQEALRSALGFILYLSRLQLTRLWLRFEVL